MLWGSGSGKFERSGSEVLFEYSNLRPNWNISNISRTISIYDHYTTHDDVGDYSDFWVDINLFKYDAPSDKFSELYPTYLFSHVYFWPHSNGNVIIGNDGQPVPFFIREMEHKYLSDTDASRDILSLHFVATDFCDITGSLI